jgi:hypothetical protein
MIRASLKFKVGFYIVIALTVAVFIFTFMVRAVLSGLIVQHEKPVELKNRTG